MTILLQILNVTLPVLYGVLVILYARLLLKDGPGDRRIAPRLLVFTVALHLTYLVISRLVLGRHPMANTFELFTFVAFAMSATYLWVERQRKNPYTGAFPLSLALLLQICSSLGRTKDAVPPELLKDPVFAWHTGSAALAMASFSLGAMYGLLFLWVYRLLKRGKSTPFVLRMPSLDVLAGMTVLATRLGFVALTLAVALGYEWALRTPGADLADPKIVATLVVWLVYASALAGHRLMRWGGWRVVSMTLGAYGVMLVSLLVVGRLVSSFHRFVE